MVEFPRRGVMLVLASPSGAGKSSITRALFSQDLHIALSVSVTTRARRTDEVEGQHYYFRTVKQFEAMRANGELLEWAKVHDNFYGTPRAHVEEQLAAGNDILFDIDFQGTLQLYEKCRPDMVTVFILPPSIKELKSRLERRAQDSAGTIERRLKNAKLELTDASLKADRAAIRDALANIKDYKGLASGPINFCADPTPQFQDSLLLLPSRLSSPLASLWRSL